MPLLPLDHAGVSHATGHSGGPTQTVPTVPRAAPYTKIDAVAFSWALHARYNPRTTIMFAGEVAFATDCMRSLQQQRLLNNRALHFMSGSSVVCDGAF